VCYVFPFAFFSISLSLSPGQLVVFTSFLASLMLQAFCYKLITSRKAFCSNCFVFCSCVYVCVCVCVWFIRSFRGGCSQELSCNIGITWAPIHDWGLCFVGSHHLLVLLEFFASNIVWKSCVLNAYEKSNFIALKKFIY